MTGAVTAIRENGATSGVGVLATYAYDDLGRRTSITRGNGTVTSYGYDAVSRLNSLVQDLASTGSDLTLGFSHNPASQIASSTRSNDVYAWTGHYAVNRSYTANGLNQYTAAGAVTPSYDSRGNLTAAGGPTYGYTSENLLVSATGGVTLAYDPLTRLYETVGVATTRFAYDGDQMIAEYNSSNTLQRRYVFGPGVDEPLVWYEGSGTTDRRWLHADERGSIVAVSNGSGAATQVNSYDEYGIPAAGNMGRFGYTGQAWLPELGMWYYRARMYSPTLGRFMQTDPIGYGDGLNWYNYVDGDPVNGSDPSGLLVTCTGSIISHSDGFDCGGPGGPANLFINGVDAAAAYESRVLEVQASLPAGTSIGIIRRVISCMDNFRACVASQQGNSSRSHYEFLPITEYERSQLDEAMATLSVLRAMRSAWRSTLETGHEFSFFIYQDYEGNYYPGYIW